MCQATKESHPLSSEDFEQIKKAVWKATPMPVIKTFAEGLYGECPVCEKVSSIDDNYCSKCGQKLFFERKKENK